MNKVNLFFFFSLLNFSQNIKKIFIKSHLFFFFLKINILFMLKRIF
jgi:hypothetical protein